MLTKATMEATKRSHTHTQLTMKTASRAKGMSVVSTVGITVLLDDPSRVCWKFDVPGNDRMYGTNTPLSLTTIL